MLENEVMAGVRPGTPLERVAMGILFLSHAKHFCII